MRPARRLLLRLADGRIHGGARLAAELGIGPSSIRALVGELRELGIRITGERGRGYRIAQGLELLDEPRVLGALGLPGRAALRGLEILFDVDSTNDYLGALARNGAPHPYACVAEMQTAGRGRRGRVWRSPIARNVYLSLLWRFTMPGRSVLGLSPAVAVAVADALEDLGVRNLALKWPNDLRWRGRKLGGVLLDVSHPADKDWYTVIGVGLNVRMETSLAHDIEQPWVDLETALGRPVSRNVVAARVIDHLLTAAQTFEARGFSAFRQAWARRDEARGHLVELSGPERAMEGIAMGLDDDGALLISVAGKVERVWSGDLSLRMGE